MLGIELNNAYFDISLLRIIDVVEHDLAIDPSREFRPRRGQGLLVSSLRRAARGSRRSERRPCGGGGLSRAGGP